MITAEVVLPYFDLFKLAVVQTDAGTVGLGAVLMLNEIPMAYASRSLTSSEQHYAPIELECLAIVFGQKQFDQYVFGIGHGDAQDHQ